MAKAAGRSVSVPVEVKPAPQDDGELVEIAARLADLGRAQEEARGAIGENDPNYAAAFERLFIAVARLNPMHAVETIRALAMTDV
jgi:hypothetical protein